MLTILDGVCLQLGERMELASRGSLEEWSWWVERETPFTVEEGRMLRAVFLAHKVLPSDVVEKLPRPWQALWTVPAGRIGHGMPRSAASSKRASGPELLAARLMQSSPDLLSQDVVAALAGWLHERTGDVGSRDQP